MVDGVEDAGTAQALTDLQCGVVPGFLFCRPIPAADVTEYLRSVTAAARWRPVAPEPLARPEQLV